MRAAMRWADVIPSSCRSPFFGFCDGALSICLRNELITIKRSDRTIEALQALRNSNFRACEPCAWHFPRAPGPPSRGRCGRSELVDLVDRTVGVMSNILAFTRSPVQFYVLMDEQSPRGGRETSKSFVPGAVPGQPYKFMGRSDVCF